jgi:hypothetical protein
LPTGQKRLQKTSKSQKMPETGMKLGRKIKLEVN